MADFAEALSNRPKPGMKKELDHLRVSEAENGGHVVEHYFASNGGSWHEPEPHVFGKGEGQAMLAHVAKHMNVKTKEE